MYVLVTALQVFAAIIPGEPFEIAAGYAFGWFGGTLLAMLGIALGQAIVFGIIRKFGRRALDLFIPQSKVESIKFFRDTGNMFLSLIHIFLSWHRRDSTILCITRSFREIIIDFHKLV